MSETPFVEPSLGRTAGLRGTVLSFGPGRMSVIVQPYAPVNLGGPTDTYTVELWIRASPTQTVPNGASLIPLVAWGSTIKQAPISPYNLYLNATTGALVATRVTDHGTTQITALPDGGSLLDGKYHHLALMRSKIDSSEGTTYYMKVSIDGEVDPSWRKTDTNQSVDASAGPTVPLLFGGAIFFLSANEFNNVAFTGEMSQVRVWRGGMTQEQLDAVRYEGLRGPIALWNITPTFASGTVTFSGTNSTVINAGTLLQSPDGQQFATIEDAEIASGTANAAVVAMVAGTDGDLPSNALSLTQTISGVNSITSTSMTGGSVGDGSQPATGWVKLTNSSQSYNVTVAAGTVVGAGPLGPFFILLSGATIDATNNKSFAVRALTAGASGNVAAGAINWIDPEGLTWSSESASDSDLGVTNVSATTNGADAVPTTVATGSVTFHNAGAEMAIVQVGTVVGQSSAGPYFQVTEQQNIQPGEDATADILAVDAGEEYNLDADAITWISPMYLVPETTTITSSTATTGGLDPHKTCVGCWCMDEGFGQVVFNYAAPDSPPVKRGDPTTYKGDGTFDISYPGLLDMIQGQDADFTAPIGMPVWKISTLMAPPAFIQSIKTGG
ncbi:MAG: baseplate J/gp47 family protein [Alphaproteobacteria bacterium]|nr:baseplate J/gp47 family protein [Alphaproteobacteria bacterium]